MRRKPIFRIIPLAERGTDCKFISTLRNHAKTILQLWLDSVVPFGKSFVALQSKRSNLIGCGFETARVVSAVEISSDPKSGLGLGRAGIVEDLLVRIQGFARPVA
jgi:hypothetical protein